ncbi:MAG: Ig-like domain-containing protein [Desulfobacterales bacterium]
MKWKIKSITIIAFLLLGLFPTSSASADPVVLEGSISSAELAVTVPYKDFMNGGDRAIYLGNPPTDIGLSNNTIKENNTIYSLVGTLSTVDADADDTFIYSLVEGDGDDGNDSFFIFEGEDKLLAVESFNHEAQETYSVRIRATDSDGLFYEKSFIITVLESKGNEKPVADPQTVETMQNRGVDITLAGSDEDGDTLVFNLDEPPKHGTLSGINAYVRYQPDPHFVGTDSFQFTVSDDEGLESDPATVTIIVNGVNYFPLFLY